jgi:1-acyl-sn-glycerol-3-phosphate acyltransferase
MSSPTGPMSSTTAHDHDWLPQASCDAGCLLAGGSETSRRLIVRLIVVLRVTLRATLVLLLALALPLLMPPLPGRSLVTRAYCRLVLRCLGVRIAVSGGPIRNLPGVLVVSDHTSWLDVVTIGAVFPASRWWTQPLSFVARADMASNLAVQMMARIIKTIPIDRASLRQLPGVVDTVAARLRAGHTVVAFPEGTTWCGRPGDDVDAAAASHGDNVSRATARGGVPASRAAARGRVGQSTRVGVGQSCPGAGPFYPAMFQAAIDAGRPVQPLRLRYHHQDGSVSTVPAYIGDDTLLRSIRRLLAARRTLARVYVESLQLPGVDRRELARRCQAAVRMTASPPPRPGQRRPVLALLSAAGRVRLPISSR